MRWIVLLLLAGCGGAAPAGLMPEMAERMRQIDAQARDPHRPAGATDPCLVSPDGLPYCHPAPGETFCRCTEPVDGK